MSRIHATAVVDAGAVLGEGNVIGPFAVIHRGVQLGDDNWIGAGVVLGAPPEVRSFPHPRHSHDEFGEGVILGSHNVLREGVQIHQGWKHPTIVGDEAFIMNQAYVAHDCEVRDGATLASSVLLAGHVVVGARANIGLGAKVHQFRRIGQGAMIGMGSVVTSDVPDFAKAYGVPSRVVGANVVGMQRAGLSDRDAFELDRRYREGLEYDDIVERLLG